MGITVVDGCLSSFLTCLCSCSFGSRFFPSISFAPVYNLDRRSAKIFVALAGWDKKAKAKAHCAIIDVGRGDETIERRIKGATERRQRRRERERRKRNERC